MSIKVHVQVDFYTGDLIKWIISKTGYDGKITMQQHDKRHVPLDIDYVQSTYPYVCELMTDGCRCEYYTECPGLIVFTELSDAVLSFVAKHQFSDEGLQHIMHARCITTQIYKNVSSHLELHNDTNVYYWDGVYIVVVDTTSIISDYLHDKYPKDDANAFNDSFDLEFSPNGLGDCRFSASWIVSNDND